MEGITFYYDWEASFMEWLQSLAGPVVTAIASFMTMFGEELVLVGILGFVYWCYDKKLGRFVGTNLIAALMAGPLIKNIVTRRRPYFDNASIKCLKAVDADADLYDIAAQGYSFPSMHASNTAATYGSIALRSKNKWVKPLIGVLIFLIGLSRVVVGVHYPTDVLAGWVLGFGMLALVSLLQKKISNPLVLMAIFGVLSLPGWFYCKSNDFFTAYGLLIGMYLGFWLDERFVKFENTRSIVRCILRVIGGVAIFLGLNELLKLPFDKSFLECGSFAAHLVRALRYFVVSAVVIGAYPLVFKYTAGIGKKNK